MRHANLITIGKYYEDIVLIYLLEYNLSLQINNIILNMVKLDKNLEYCLYYFILHYLDIP